MTLISPSFQDQKVSKNKTQILNLLQESSNRSSEILNEFTSENTKKAFFSDIMYWKAWLSAVGLNFESKHKSIDIEMFHRSKD